MPFPLNPDVEFYDTCIKRSTCIKLSLSHSPWVTGLTVYIAFKRPIYICLVLSYHPTLSFSVH